MGPGGMGGGRPPWEAREALKPPKPKNLQDVPRYLRELVGVSPVAPLFVIVVSVPSAIITFVYRNKNFRYMRFRSKERRQMNYYSEVQVNKDLVKEVKLFGLSDTFVDRYNNVFTRYFKGIRKLVLEEGAWSIATALVAAVVNGEERA